MTIGTAISTGLSVVSAVKGMSSANKAEKRAGAAQDAQIGIAGRQEDRADEQFQLWKDNYLKDDQRIFEQNKALDPQELAARGAAYDASAAGSKFYADEVIPGQSQLIKDAAPNYDYVTSKAAADADQSQQRNAGIYERQNAEAGVDPSSGAAIAGRARMKRDAAGVRAANVTGARERERDSSFKKLATATGRTYAGVSAPNASNLSGINSGSLSGAARTYGGVSRDSFGRAQTYANAAGSSARGATNAISDFQNGGGFGDLFSGGGSPSAGGGPAYSIGNDYGYTGIGIGLKDGGPADAGTTHIVGEEGPEILQQNPDGGGTVIPLNGGVAPPQQPQQPQIDPAMAEQMIREYLTRGQAGIRRSMQ